MGIYDYNKKVDMLLNQTFIECEDVKRTHQCPIPVNYGPDINELKEDVGNIKVKLAMVDLELSDLNELRAELTRIDNLLTLYPDPLNTATKTEIRGLQAQINSLNAQIEQIERDIPDVSDYYKKSEIDSKLALKQQKLISGQNIKTINNISLLGEGNINIEGAFIIDVSKNYTYNELKEGLNNNPSYLKEIYTMRNVVTYNLEGSAFTNEYHVWVYCINHNNSTNINKTTSSYFLYHWSSNDPEAIMNRDPVLNIPIIQVDNELLPNSKNPVQNKVVKSAIDELNTSISSIDTDITAIESVVSTLNTYSQYVMGEERQIGTLLEGGIEYPVFRKVIDCGGLPSEGTVDILHGITGSQIYRVLEFNVFAMNVNPSTGNFSSGWSIPYTSPSNLADSVRSQFGGTKITLAVGRDRSAFNRVTATVVWAKKI